MDHLVVNIGSIHLVDVNHSTPCDTDSLKNVVDINNIERILSTPLGITSGVALNDGDIVVSSRKVAGVDDVSAAYVIVVWLATSYAAAN